MQNRETIRKKLNVIDGKDYGAYQSLIGVYEYPQCRLFIDQIPKDPYAPPHTGIYRLQVPYNYVLLPSELNESHIIEAAFRDFLARRFYDVCMRISNKRRGTGYSGIITIDEPGQVILKRSSFIVTSQYIEVRFFIGLPAAGRNITSSIAEKMLCEELPQIIEFSLSRKNIKKQTLDRHLETAVDAEYLRNHLDSLQLVAFIANGAKLPRKSGTSDCPLESTLVVPFRSPDTLRVEIELPHAGIVRGMGIPRGVTLIVGGGYHGKSTLLNTIAYGVYNHIPCDGREQCVSNRNTIKIRSYSGRYVEKVDISPFIKNLPTHIDTKAFSTENASGSTSQAASIQEAIEAGAEVFLMDEDTCATNFMIRDHKMQMLVRKDDEPITAFIDRARQLLSEKGISTILVLGGVGDYFDIADHVIQMKEYVPLDVTKSAKEISKKYPAKRSIEDQGCQVNPRTRIPMPNSIDPYNEHNKKSIYTTEIYRIHFGKTIIDLTDVEQLIELSQTKAIGKAIIYLQKYIDGKKPLKEILDLLMLELDKKGIDIISEKISGHLAEFRALELAFAVNRLRGITMVQ
jgi:predicted ABC-class ATPase